MYHFRDLYRGGGYAKTKQNIEKKTSKNNVKIKRKMWDGSPAAGGNADDANCGTVVPQQEILPTTPNVGR